MGTSNPLVSFALLAYNQERYIREALCGALAQTYSPLEIIISDDASTDRTFDIIQEMAAAYQGPHKIILNRNERNLGIGAHVEKVFRLAAGEWLIGAAGDDISLPHRCQVLIAAAMREGPECFGIGSGWVSIDEYGEVVIEETPAEGFLKVQKQMLHVTGLHACKRVLIDRANQLPGCTAMWRTSLVKDWPPFLSDLTWEDQTLSCRAHLAGKVQILDDRLVKYRISHEALTNAPRGDIINDLQARQKHEARNQEAIVAMIVGMKQFLLDLQCFDPKSILNKEISNLVEVILNRIKELEIVKDWYHLTMPQRLGRLITGHRYPFGKRGFNGIKQVIPTHRITNLQLSMERLIRNWRVRKSP